MRIQLQRFAAPEIKSSSQRDIEVLENLHRDCVNHLLVKAWIGFGGFQSVLKHQKGVIEVDRLVISLASSIEIQHMDSAPTRLGAKWFIWDLNGNSV